MSRRGRTTTTTTTTITHDRPVRNRVDHYHHGDRHYRGRRPGGFFGGLVGGIIGGAIVSASNQSEPERSEKKYVPTLDAVLKQVTSTPEGAVVYLNIEEFRILKEKNLITYKESTPYCMDRIIEV